MRGVLLAALAVLALAGLLATTPAGAGQAQEPARSPKLAGAQPASQCVSCHSPGDERLLSAAGWGGSIDREVGSGCAAASRVREEIYYTERLLLAIDRARAELPARVDASKTDARIEAARQTYSRLLDTQPTSLDAFVSEAQVLRFRLGKSYAWLNQAHEAVKAQRVLLVAGAVTLFLLASLAWGLRLTQRFASGRKGPSSKMGRGIKAAVFVTLVLILFSLPIFRVPAQEVESASEEEQARQTALDTADRVADVAERAMARAWALARVGAEWAELEPQPADQALEAALAAAEETRQDAAALWGGAQAVREGTIGAPAAQEKAGLAAGRLDAVHSRAWALQLIAREWAAVDPDRAEAVLREALAVANRRSGLYRELDVRAIAVTWASIDPEQGLAAAERVYDPALRAWALWEIAATTGEAAVYDRAAEAARQVADPVDRARALREIGAHSGDEALFQEALAALEGVEGAERAYALSDLAAAAGDAAVAAQVDPAYPDARAAALYRAGSFEEAWTAAGAIDDPYDRARAQAAIAGAWGNADAARQIADPTLRSLALRDAAIARQELALAHSIEAPYYRVQALTALGEYQAALDAAEGLSDAYPLRALAAAWAETDPQAALAVVDLMEREVDKAEALRAVAAATGEDDVFERALGMALAARVRGDTLAPVEASLALARAFAESDPAKAQAAFAQAYDAAQRITVKYK
jgi:hypothetical protein